MSALAPWLLAVLVNGWLAGAACLLLALAVDRPALLPARARHLGLLAAMAGTVLLALGAGAGRGGGGGLAVGPESAVAGWVGRVWLAGALTLLAREGGGHLRLHRLRGTWRAAGPDERAAAGLPRGLPLLTGPAGSPLTLGLLRPAVYLPERCLRELPAGSLRAVAAHEAAHARWRDPATWALARLARIVLWPVAPLWLLERRLHRASEEAADAAATAKRGPEERAEYCRTLLAVASWPGSHAIPPAVPAMAGTRLERRLRAVLRPRRPGRRGAALALVVALASLVLLGALPWARAAPGAVERVERVVHRVVLEVRRP